MSEGVETTLEARLAAMERLLQEIAGVAGLASGNALTIDQAKAWLGYNDRDSFMTAVKRDGIPYIRQNAKRVVFNRVDLARWKEARKVQPVIRHGRLVA